ncbi:MAG: fatty acid desaturase [Ignavibacteriaceae bacterium]|jgi:fatty acid desaturase|nr:fatty acid desaturase [Ignavibacteriaceae bacterium]MCW8812552.1 fatty acid desaturase [Chlorobium sp.]MCW8996291.1 fatty acid desaturase [Psychromonas sp.]MCW8818150.1 fatty acid desaturase [Ignavibacteriaceae bacterium]MCW8824179.1 fatty acid desaturase [Ignavibacteriaceae bacterium]
MNLKLKNSADIKSLIYIFITTVLLLTQWMWLGVNPFIYTWYLFMAVTVAVVTHNHNHLPMWRSKTLNLFTDWWLTVFYGFPIFAWIPTHNKNHHRFNNREGDDSITYRVSEKNNFLTLISYPTISGYYQQKAIFGYLKDLKANNKEKFWVCISQYVVLVVWIAAALIIDWEKALLFVIIPQQVSLFSVLIFNYVQHVHANEESEWNHSRNYTGFLNFLLFNNGYHTIHHHKAGLHWNKVPEAHKEIEKNIDPILLERSFWWYIIRSYFLSIFIPKFRTNSMRLERLRKEQIENKGGDINKESRIETLIA